ncbi:YbjN domain-containing protein [Thalassiella azotivora]
MADLGEDAGVGVEPGARQGEYVLQLPGEHKLRTTVSVIVGERSLSVSAFVIRHPDENEGAFHRWLLERNARLRGAAFALDGDGDVYLVGRVPLEGVTPSTVDALMGVVARTADESFDELLVLGFLGSMRKEWQWRVSRGESTRNLEAFRHLLERDGGS